MFSHEAGHLCASGPLYLYPNNPNLTLPMPELSESNEICPIFLMFNLRNLQYLGFLSIPMPQFGVVATLGT